jgi:hypothetical protein
VSVDDVTWRIRGSGRKWEKCYKLTSVLCTPYQKHPPVSHALGTYASNAATKENAVLCKRTEHLHEYYRPWAVCYELTNVARVNAVYLSSKLHLFPNLVSVKPAHITILNRGLKPRNNQHSKCSKLNILNK